jgi:beta-xylosidase
VYFVVNSSFHLFPGLPIYASTDLKTWTHIGTGKKKCLPPYHHLV